MSQKEVVKIEQIIYKAKTKMLFLLIFVLNYKIYNLLYTCTMKC